MDPANLQFIVKRVARRALGQGSAATLPAQRSAGVRVELTPSSGPMRPANSGGRGGPARDAAGLLVVTAEELAGTQDGATFAMPAGARLTPMAREEAWRRGIDLREGVATGPRRLRVALGADHGGFPVKEDIKGWLRELGHAALDLGTHDKQAVDYPDFARAVAEAVADGRVDLGVCVDGAGIGSSITANKVPGVRAALCYDEVTARNAREHNFANVLCLGGPLLGAEACAKVLRAFLETPEGAARHALRVDKIGAIEAHYTGRRVATKRILPQPGGG